MTNNAEGAFCEFTERCFFSAILPAKINESGRRTFGLNSLKAKDLKS